MSRFISEADRAAGIPTLGYFDGGLDISRAIPDVSRIYILLFTPPARIPRNRLSQEELNSILASGENDESPSSTTNPSPASAPSAPPRGWTIG